MAQQRSYFLAPSWDYQKDGPLALGNIFTDASDPVFSTLTKFPSNETLLPKIYNNAPEPWSQVEARLRSGGAELFARFEQICDANVSTNYETEREQTFSMESMQTSYFVPDNAYLATRFQDGDIKDWIAGRRFYQSKCMYIITGVKIARSLIREEVNKRKLGFGAGGNVDGTAIAVSAGGGGLVDFNIEDNTTTSGETSSDVVFGYQVRKIRERKTDVKNEPHNDGAFLSLEDILVEDSPVLEFDVDDHDASFEEMETNDTGNRPNLETHDG